MTLDLTDEEAAALARHLRRMIDYARYPYALRLDPLTSILAKLQPPRPAPVAFANLRTIATRWPKVFLMGHPV
jgi:hypothetical protein